jgi:hypothetical protein
VCSTGGRVDEKLFKEGNFHVRSVPNDVDISGLDVFAFLNAKDNGLLATPKAHKFIPGSADFCRGAPLRWKQIRKRKRHPFLFAFSYLI